MKWDSIKIRLLVMTVVCVLGMGLLMVSQNHFSAELIRINQQRALLLQLSQDLLQMRRHEKDYLLRKDSHYLVQLKQRAATFQQRLAALSPVFNDYSLPVTQASELADDVNRYEADIEQMAALTNELGVSSSKGLWGKISQAEYQLSKQVALSQSLPIHVIWQAVTQARRNYQLETDPKYFADFQFGLQQLRNSENQITLDPELLTQYERAFRRYFQIRQSIGLTQNMGLRFSFRSHAHKLEDTLNAVDDALQPLIQEQESRVRAYGLFIAAGTSVALILLLIKSFATFHRAFANFVLFFYRSKRQYQKIDPRQLGFAEFRSLAELANEMVESRRKTEQRLAEYESVSKL